MKKNKISTILALIFVALAISCSVFADDVVYRYTRVGGDLITNGTVPDATQENVTLPNTTWNLELSDTSETFKVTLSGINASYAGGYPVLDINASTVTVSSQDYSDSPTLKYGSGNTYDAKYAYAFNIDQVTDKAYTVSIDYSGISGVSNPALFKCEHNFTTGFTNTSTCVRLTSSVANNVISAVTTNFSSFFLAQYTAPGGGGGGGGTGTGGGGGGGGLGGPRIIYVTPTPEGSSVQLYNGDELVVQYKGADYHYRVVKVQAMKVELKSLQTYLPFTIEFGETKSMGFTSFFAKEADVSMHVSNDFVMLTFKSVEKKPFMFPLLPAKSPSKAPAQTGAAGQQLPTAVYTPRPATAPAGAAAGETPQQVQLPESPINMWTLIFAGVFIIFLVGGVALYRSRLHHLEKPPTVTRTGLEPTGLPETSSKRVSEPAPTLKQAEPKKAEMPAVEEKSKPVKPIVLSHEKKLELEKYIFHAYSMGFKEAQVRRALVGRGWPEQVVDQVMAEIKAKKQ